jgi:hypothetical protein
VSEYGRMFVWWGKDVAGWWGRGYRLAHCWVLRQQGLLFWLFACVPVFSGHGRVAGVGDVVVSGFLRMSKGCTGWCGWRGVTGLLFENYIVDASILIRSNF